MSKRLPLGLEHSNGRWIPDNPMKSHCQSFVSSIVLNSIHVEKGGFELHELYPTLVYKTTSRNRGMKFYQRVSLRVSVNKLFISMKIEWIHNLPRILIKTQQSVPYLKQHSILFFLNHKIIKIPIPTWSYLPMLLAILIHQAIWTAVFTTMITNKPIEKHMYGPFISPWTLYSWMSSFTLERWFFM